MQVGLCCSLTRISIGHTLPVAFTTNRFLGCCKSYRMSASLKQQNIKNISVQCAYVGWAKIQTIFAGAHLGGGECSSHCRDQAAAGEDKIGKSCTKYKMLIILTASIMWGFKSAKRQKTILFLITGSDRAGSGNASQQKSPRVRPGASIATSDYLLSRFS